MQENRFGLFDAVINTSMQLCKTTVHRNIQKSCKLLAKCDNRYLSYKDEFWLFFFSPRDLSERERDYLST